MRIRGFTAAIAAAAALILTAVTPALGQNASPNPSPARGAAAYPARSAAPAGTAIKAVVVKSWGQCSSGSLVWDDLNANWSQYGSTPIVIDYSDPSLCGDSFTLAALEASGAHVVILDDPAGGIHQFTPDEITALQTYASEGHNLLGTYLTFGYPIGGIDNTALAPLFGLKQGAGWTGGDSSMNPTYTLHRRKARALLRHIPNPYVSTGFNESQRPGDGVWSKNELSGARIAGISGDKLGAITAYKAASYYAAFIANMPEYGGGTQDKQFIYNAIIHA